MGDHFGVPHGQSKTQVSRYLHTIATSSGNLFPMSHLQIDIYVHSDISVYTLSGRSRIQILCIYIYDAQTRLTSPS